MQAVTVVTAVYGTHRYTNRWEFAEDIELMFRNCAFFNEDTSEVSWWCDIMGHHVTPCDHARHWLLCRWAERGIA